MAESRFVKELEKYEYIQFVIPDVNNIPRGKIVTGKFREKVAKHGFEVGNGESRFSLSLLASLCISLPPPVSFSLDWALQSTKL